MTERVDTIVIGAGHAGLSTSYHLARRGRDHIVLERGRVADTWRTCRWDGFYLNTPNWAQMLPGHAFEGSDPDGFAPLAQVIAYLEEYATMIGADLREGVEATALRRVGDDGYAVETEGGELRAANVVVATGAYQRPTPIPFAQHAPADVFQLDTNAYRRPDQLPPGSVLVVGGGQSGCQIADELLEAGRRVYLSVGRCPWFPRRYRGRDIVRWAIDVGLMDQTVDTMPLPEARLACNPPVSGNDGGHDCNPRWLAHRGAVLVGRVEGFDDTQVRLGEGLEENLAKGDAFTQELIAKLEAHIATHGLDLPEPEPPVEGAVAVAHELDLRAAGITTILWAGGYRPDYGWIDLPVTVGLGWPVQTRGVTVFEGLYFVGVHWLHKRKSSLFLGVGEDAEHVVEHLVARGRGGQ
jgi:putative flavoprotein involved in K+ transport